MIRVAMKTMHCFLFLLATTFAALGAAPEIPPAFGPHVNLAPADFANVPSFSATQRIVGTYFFYWYDSSTKEHIIDGDGTDALTTHPASLNDFSYRSVAWHKRQLADMIEAGIDVVLPVFWGAPSEHATNAGLHWSYVGIPKLVEAREQLLSEGKTPPRIGLFYDTSTLQYNQWHQRVDLTTDYGQRWFYATVRDFFSMVPPKHWAMIEGKPIMLLYSAAFAKKHDQQCIDYTRREFAREFGGRIPWIAREVSWSVKTESTVAWGGALGLKNPGVASLGPGYDHSAVPGRTPLIVDRRSGTFYEENWTRFLRRPSTFVMVETWNEFHEGTDVAESREYGRKFIELTRKYSDLFHAGAKPPMVAGKYTDSSSVAIRLGFTVHDAGITQVDNDDGVTMPVTVAERSGRRIAPGAGHYMYFIVDESFKAAAGENFTLEVDYFDAAPGELALEYDGSDERAPFNGAYTRSSDVAKLNGDRTWKTARYSLAKAKLLNGQNRNADFRFVFASQEVAIAGVRLSKR